MVEGKGWGAYQGRHMDRDAHQVSLEIQNRLARVDRYNAWIVRKISLFLGQRILDVGCSIGNITQFFLDRERVVGIEVSSLACQAIREKFKDSQIFKAIEGDISMIDLPSLKAERFDTVTFFNVLEHIEDDQQVLQKVFELLEPKGRIILLVPALKALYGSMDRADHHFRRYTKSELRSRAETAGFITEKLSFMNPLGIVGWYLNGKIFKREFVPEGHYALYNHLVPFLSWVEERCEPPIGLSLIYVGSKPS